MVQSLQDTATTVNAMQDVSAMEVRSKENVFYGMLVLLGVNVGLFAYFTMVPTRK
jgi:hypothetical protein|tara:strand:+ start:597 stop:761 length:165 start_codon:yes stop_codon:yes gene_type:complete